MAVRKNAEGKWEFVVDGKVVRTVDPTDEEALYGLVSKGVGADTRFEEAATTLKTVREKEQELLSKAQEFQQLGSTAERTRVRELLTKAQKGDQEAYSQVLDLYGLDGADKEAHLETYRKQYGTRDPQVDGRGGASTGGQDTTSMAAAIVKAVRASIEEELGMPLAHLKEAAQFSITQGQEATRTSVFKNLHSDLASDPFLAKVLSSDGPSAKRVKELAEKEIRSRIRDGAQFGPALLKDVTAYVKGWATDLGLGQKTVSTLGLSSSPALAQVESQAAEPVKPVSPMSEDYQSNLAARLLRMSRDEAQE